MPILEVEIVASGESEKLPAGLTQYLADTAAKIFNTPQGTTWVKVRVIPSGHYAEDHMTPLGVHPVFVTVLKSKVPDEKRLEAEIIQLTGAVAKILNRPETNVHIQYQPDGAGRVAFGGQLVR